MTIQSWFMYISLVLAATSIPGPAVLYIVTNATFHGWKKSTFAALGNIVGLFCLGLMSVAGLGTILKTSEVFFNIIKYAGAAYLIFLGVKLVIQKNPDFSQVTIRESQKKGSGTHIFLQALGVALSNPKAIIFLTALFPQFIDVNKTLFPQFALLIAILMSFSFIFLMGYAVLAHKATAWIANPHRIKIFNRASGSIFICFGFLLATSSSK